MKGWGTYRATSTRIKQDGQCRSICKGGTHLRGTKPSVHHNIRGPLGSDGMRTWWSRKCRARWTIGVLIKQSPEHVSELSRLPRPPLLASASFTRFPQWLPPSGAIPYVSSSNLPSHHTRHEFYETDEKLTLTVFDRGADPANVNVKLQPRSVRSIPVD